MEMLGGLNANIVVRFPPAETVNIAGYTKTDNVFFDRPGHVFEMSRVGDRDLTREDDDRYMDLLSHASVVVGGPSTFAIDAALFDKPILLVDFYPKEVSEEEKIYEYGAEHFMHILDTQGVYRAKTKEDFLKHMEMYLKNSSLDHAGRIRIVSEQCWNSDGKSSDRVAQSVLK
jgi:CDP-glycerol glycerophosphotransferase (TagB/SpsB family)